MWKNYKKYLMNRIRKNTVAERAEEGSVQREDPGGFGIRHKNKNKTLC